jgi:hypothetical protein
VTFFVGAELETLTILRDGPDEFAILTIGNTDNMDGSLRLLIVVAMAPVKVVVVDPNVEDVTVEVVLVVDDVVVTVLGALFSALFLSEIIVQLPISHTAEIVADPGYPLIVIHERSLHGINAHSSSAQFPRYPDSTLHSITSHMLSPHGTSWQ